MSTTDIMYAAWNKDAVALKSAIDAEMSSRAVAAIDSMKADVAANMFGLPHPEPEVVEEPLDQTEPVEGTTTDENV